jgi:hypothetical protein
MSFPVAQMEATICKIMKKVIKKVKEEHHFVEDMARKNDSNMDHTPDEEETKDESNQLSKKKQKNPQLEHWRKVLKDEPNHFTKITATLDQTVFCESGNKKISTAKKAAKQKAWHSRRTQRSTTRTLSLMTSTLPWKKKKKHC